MEFNLTKVYTVQSCFNKWKVLATRKIVNINQNKFGGLKIAIRCENILIESDCSSTFNLQHCFDKNIKKNTFLICLMNRMILLESILFQKVNEDTKTTQPMNWTLSIQI